MSKYQNHFDQLKNIKNHYKDDDDEFDLKKTTGAFNKTKKIHHKKKEKNTCKTVSPLNERKRNLHPQIIDEDTEEFKYKLETLIGGFKKDAVNEFIGMKKALLDEQK